MTPKRRPAETRATTAAPKGGWWREAIALPPRKAYVYERADKGGGLYVEQYAPELGNWQRASLKLRLADAQGKRLRDAALTAQKQVARDAAAAVLDRWERERKGEITVAEKAVPLTLGKTAAELTHPDTGKFPAANGKPEGGHAREVLRSITFAARILGPETSWAAIELDAFTTVWRARIREAIGQRRRAPQGEVGEKVLGLRPAVIVIRDLLSTANWLRERKRIPMTAAVAPTTWQKLLRADWVTIRGKEFRTKTVPPPRRERHSEAEMRQLLVAAWTVDPRLGLLLAIGAEQRAGQVERLMRRLLDLEEPPHGQARIPGGGDTKLGAVVKFTPGQRADVDRCLTTGYLRALEAAFQAGEIDDYPVFPSGQMPGGRKGTDPVATVTRHATAGFLSGTALRKWFREAESAAGIDHVRYRAFHGVRRAGADGVKARKGSREALAESGGWANSQIPDAIYADQERGYARDEAMELRARIRGEVPDPAPAATRAPTTLPPDPATEPAEGAE